MDNESTCDGVVECTALVLAESCAELDGRLTLFGILDELRPNGTDGGYSFVIYAKFEGCEHADGGERRARILITDEEGEVLEESAEYSVWLSGEESPATIVTGASVPSSQMAYSPDSMSTSPQSSLSRIHARRSFSEACSQPSNLA